MPAILAIDFGKFNSILCHFDPATREAAFRTMATTPAKLREKHPAWGGRKFR